MNNSIKQIYASIQICENSIKLIVAEYFNTRFNVLRVGNKDTKSINEFKIVDKQMLINDIKYLIDECSTKLGARIEQVILIIPAYNFKRFPLKSKVIPDNGILTKKDIARAVSNSLKANVDYDVMVINPVINKYTINGISTRRVPEKEPCSEAIVDIDLLCADKEMTYDYVQVVEESGIKVLDIALNNYSIGKEASLIEESLRNNIICLDINRSYTYLSLFSKGKLASTELVYEGFGSIIDVVKANYNIPENDIIKLLKYNVDYDTQYQNDIVYAYSENNTTKSITTRDLNEICLKSINSLADKLITMCKPIIETGASLFITGEGQQINTLFDKIKELSICEAKSYYPDTIGVRDSSLTALYGSLFVYKDKAVLNGLNVNCIDLLQYDSKVSNKQIDTEGETITTKIKNLFKQYVEKEED